MTMTQPFVNTTRKIYLLLLLTLTSFYTFAQDKVTLDAEEVESWFERNWMWVAGAVVFIILLGLLTGSRNRKTRVGNQRKTTTVVKDTDGNVKSVTTTEENL
jgi:cytochrome bd-type quinol oxidase subunit 2